MCCIKEEDILLEENKFEDSAKMEPGEVDLKLETEPGELEEGELVEGAQVKPKVKAFVTNNPKVSLCSACGKNLKNMKCHISSKHKAEMVIVEAFQKPTPSKVDKGQNQTKVGRLYCNTVKAYRTLSDTVLICSVCSVSYAPDCMKIHIEVKHNAEMMVVSHPFLDSSKDNDSFTNQETEEVPMKPWLQGISNIAPTATFELLNPEEEENCGPTSQSCVIKQELDLDPDESDTEYEPKLQMEPEVLIKEEWMEPVEDASDPLDVASTLLPASQAAPKRRLERLPQPAPQPRRKRGEGRLCSCSLCLENGRTLQEHKTEDQQIIDEERRRGYVENAKLKRQKKRLEEGPRKRGRRPGRFLPCPCTACQEAGHTIPEHNVKLTSAERSRRWEEKVKNNPDLKEAYKKRNREKSARYRKNLTPVQLARERLRGREFKRKREGIYPDYFKGPYNSKWKIKDAIAVSEAVAYLNSEVTSLPV